MYRWAKGLEEAVAAVRRGATDLRSVRDKLILGIG
jgi:hypothetical protein